MTRGDKVTYRRHGRRRTGVLWAVKDGYLVVASPAFTNVADQDVLEVKPAPKEDE